MLFPVILFIFRKNSVLLFICVPDLDKAQVSETSVYRSDSNYCIFYVLFISLWICRARICVDY